ncbi:MAG TPA: penicillin-binding protein 1B [Rhodanobacteraceae bacterium]|nr:penicillin-binding protein 1B [Rhodanobacteraceae bacterium]
MNSLPAFLSRLRDAWLRAWPVMRWPLLIGIGFAIGFLLPYTLVLDARVRVRVGEIAFSQPTRVFAKPVQLAPGEAMNADTLMLELASAGYTEEKGEARVPGTFSRDGERFVIASRGYADPAGGELPRRVRVTLSHGQVDSVKDLTSRHVLHETHLDPARIATLYGAEQEERQVVKLDELPPLLVSGLQAVEDRDFKHHWGIDVSAILRAAFANLRAGHVVQGASTLTQQLVRNLFLDRNKSFVRKFNEALLSVLIEAHYTKAQILDAYCNEVFLGQQGNQAVHGFAAASQFYFARPVQTLRPQEDALLVGMVQGPSIYDPRRYPQRALARRNVALDMFHDTGLLTDAQWQAAKASPLGVTAQPQLVADRFPAFMEVVRAQLHQDFSDDQLRGGGLNVFTTLDPAAQIYAENALDETFSALGKRGRKLEGAVVITEADSGSVLAMVGARESDRHGFNRAFDARRPIGSAIKPFYYLMALAQPQRWSVASLLDDTPVSLRQPNGKVWSPSNDDHIAHGEVPMVEALAKSYNLASVHLGMDLGVGRVAKFLRSFGLDNVPANPSLLLGAIDLSPFQVAQLYQYFAADGHALPLSTLRGVTDSQGKAIKRYSVQPGEGEYQHAERLTRWAMQQVAEYGTAASLGDSSLAWLHVAGKTGTSDGQRDSWFAGFTGEHLGVVWVGRDDNKPTGLWGATGALRVWKDIFEKLPTRPLPTSPGPGIDFAWVDPATGQGIQPGCEGAREYPFIAGYAPTGEEHCFFQQLRNIFGIGVGSDHGAQQSPPANPGQVQH